MDSLSVPVESRVDMGDVCKVMSNKPMAAICAQLQAFFVYCYQQGEIKRNYLTLK